MELAARPGLLIRVAQQPAWVLGVVAEVAGFVLQVIALRHGSLVVVQPLLTTSLLFTIALAGRWTESTVRAGEWLAVVAVVAGLALFLIVASPSEESSGLADASDWIITGLSIGARIPWRCSASPKRATPMPQLTSGSATVMIGRDTFGRPAW